jgi:hypothetical protein
VLGGYLQGSRSCGYGGPVVWEPIEPPRGSGHVSLVVGQSFQGGQHEPVPGGEPAGQSLHGEVAPDPAPLRSEQLEPDDPALVRDRHTQMVGLAVGHAPLTVELPPPFDLWLAEC